MATAIESGIGALNYGRQSGKGTIATAATTTVGYNRPKWVSGALKPNKRLGKKEYVDGQRFASPTTFTDGVGGEVGSLKIEAQPENIGLYAAAVLGIDGVSGSADPYTHAITSAGTAGHWGTWWQAVGSAVGPVKQVYYDSKIAKYVLSSSAGDKPAEIELDIQALVAGKTYSTAPAKTIDSSDPFLHTECAGSFSIDSITIKEIEESILDIDTKMVPFYGDDIVPLQLIEKKGEITRTMKTIVTDETLPLVYSTFYNDSTPATGDVPVKDVFYAAMTQTFTRSVTRTCVISTSKVAIEPADITIAPETEGGPIELTLGGVCMKNGSTPAVEMTVLAADATSWA